MRRVGGQSHHIIRVLAATMAAVLLGALLYTAGSFGGPETPAIALDGPVSQSFTEAIELKPQNPAEPATTVMPDESKDKDNDTDIPGEVSPTPTGQPPAPVSPTPQPVPATPEDVPAPDQPVVEDLSDEQEDAVDPFVPEVVPVGPEPEPVAEIPIEEPEPAVVPDPVPLDPVAPDFDDPLCQETLAAGRTLYVQTPIVLQNSSSTETISLMNCGTESATWNATSPPGIDLDATDGSLQPLEVTELGFTVTAGSVEPGAFSFAIQVTSALEVTLVEVYGYRDTIGLDYAGPDSLTDGPPSCEDACIRKAELRGSPVSTDVILDIETTTDAGIVVMLSNVGPVIGPDGQPMFAQPQVVAVSDGLVREFTTVLTGLQPLTPYNIIVQAIDGADNKWVESGRFTTSSIVQPGDKAIEPLGCKVQCIDSAMVSFGEQLDQITVEVHTSADAEIVAMISTEAPFFSAGVPAFASVEATADSGGAATTFLSHTMPVAPDTLYHIIVTATDGSGQTSYQVGAFNSPTTPPPPPAPETNDVVVTFLRLWVTDDGDRIGRGELTFPFQAGTHVNKRSEQRMNTGDSFWFPYWAAYHFDDLRLDERVPLIAVSAWERDPHDGFWEEGPAQVPQTDPDHGFYSTINTMYTTGYLDSLLVGDIDGLASCETYGVAGAWAGQRCIELVSPYYDYWDFPLFRAVVAIQAAPALAIPS